MHVQLDNGWKHDFRLMRREGQTDATVAEIYDVLVRAIDRTTMLDEPVRASIRKRLFDEIFVEHGLTAEQKLPLPYPSLGPKT